MEDRRLLSVTINEFPLSGVNLGPRWITTGPDGNLWFTEAGVGSRGIGQFNPTTHTVNEFPVSSGSTVGITAGPDGNLWFTENQSSRIGTINLTTHAVTEFDDPSPSRQLGDIVTGPGGNLWFTEFLDQRIGRFDPTTHVFTRFSTPTEISGPQDITVGPDGNLWFTESESGKIAQFNPTTQIFNEFSLTVPPNSYIIPYGITAGPDGNLWFTEIVRTFNNTHTFSMVGRINPTTHEISEFPLSSPATEPLGITAGPDGNLWFTENSTATALIGQINPTTLQINELPVPSGRSLAYGITAGPDGNLWFTEQSGKIGQVQLTDVRLSTQLTGAPNPSIAGQPVTFEAVVTTTATDITPTGAVVFTIDGVAQPPVPLTLVGGQARASFTATSLAPGSHVVTATYRSDNRFIFSVSTPVSQLVLGATTATQLAGSPNPSTVGQPVTFEAVVTTTATGTTPTGAVVFTIDGVAQPPVPLTLVAGQAQATFTSTTLAPGYHVVTAAYGGDASTLPSTAGPVSQLVRHADGPTLISVKRYGFHARPTTLVLTFDRPLDSGPAQDRTNYWIGRVRGHGRLIRIKQAIYDPATHTVTLRPYRRLYLFGQQRLTVVGTGLRGLTDTLGSLLDGQRTGHPGSNATPTLNASNLALPLSSSESQTGNKSRKFPRNRFHR